MFFLHLLFHMQIIIHCFHLKILILYHTPKYQKISFDRHLDQIHKINILLCNIISCVSIVASNNIITQYC
ncbi:hypothetical protein FWK35_00000083 [Aphis craccivora]|uniref:Uncharacterized protein n=1 Tax=Aphis craccivora TaxID=307492 RepID=A0A6G0ZNF2_APHCR|nr:hypothetical protein FWK35_00000083 [Aphis craccivora]